MAQALTFHFNDQEFACSIKKVDRTKLYGSVQLEVLDESGHACVLATLANDGKTLIPVGGTALAYVSPDGNWCEKDTLKPVDLDGNEIEPVTSTFKTTTDLVREATHEEYLSHNIRLLYLLDTVEGEFPADLVKQLKEGKIYEFDFSYRGGLEADAAFIVAGQGDEIWMAVGKPTNIQFIGYEQVAAVTIDEDESDDEVDELMDFGL